MHVKLSPFSLASVLGLLIGNELAGLYFTSRTICRKNETTMRVNDRKVSVLHVHVCKSRSEITIRWLEKMCNEERNRMKRDKFEASLFKVNSLAEIFTSRSRGKFTLSSIEIMR